MLPRRSSFTRSGTSQGTASASDAAAIPVGIGAILPFRPRQTEVNEFDDRVEAALTALADRRSHAASDLYDLVSRPVYALVFAITGDKKEAELATVSAFVEMWLTIGSRPEGLGTTWVMDVACRCATAAPPRSPGPLPPKLHLVSSR